MSNEAVALSSRSQSRERPRRSVRSWLADRRRADGSPARKSFQLFERALSRAHGHERLDMLAASRRAGHF